MGVIQGDVPSIKAKLALVGYPIIHPTYSVLSPYLIILSSYPV